LEEVSGEKKSENSTENVPKKVAKEEKVEVKTDEGKKDLSSDKVEPLPLSRKINGEKNLADIIEKPNSQPAKFGESISKKDEKFSSNEAEPQPPIGAAPGEKILAHIAEKSDSQSIVAAEPIVKIGSEIVERIMLVQAVSHAKQEVIIAFKDTTLPGTQLSLTRENSTIHLVFSVKNSQSFDFLAANHVELQAFLLERLPAVNVVNIEVKGENIDHAAPRDQRQKHQRNSQKDPKNDENPEKS
jgi:hypothetical protein